MSEMNELRRAVSEGSAQKSASTLSALPRLLSAIRSAKVWLILAALTIGLMIGGYILADRHGLLLGFLIALSINTLVFFYTDLRLASLFPSEQLEGQDPWGLVHCAQNLARKIRVPIPTIRVVDTTTPIAFSAGLLPKRSSIYLSTELIKRLDKEEIEAVIAYELQRLKLRQTSATTTVAALAGLLTHLATALDQTIFLQFLRARQPGQIRPGILLFSPLIALLVRTSVSRSDVFKADRAASQLLSDGGRVLGRTLWKLDAYNKVLPLDVGIAEAHLFTVNPLVRYRWCRFAEVQPSIEDRVQKLTGHFPL